MTDEDRSPFEGEETVGPQARQATAAGHHAVGPNTRDQVKVLFPEDVCDPSSWYRFGSHGVHLQGGTWRKRKGFMRRRLNAQWESTTRKALLKESLKRGGTRSLELKSAS